MSLKLEALQESLKNSRAVIIVDTNIIANFSKKPRKELLDYPESVNSYLKLLTILTDNKNLSSNITMIIPELVIAETIGEDKYGNQLGTMNPVFNYKEQKKFIEKARKQDNVFIISPDKGSEEDIYLKNLSDFGKIHEINRNAKLGGYLRKNVADDSIVNIAKNLRDSRISGEIYVLTSDTKLLTRVVKEGVLAVDPSNFIHALGKTGLINELGFRDTIKFGSITRDSLKRIKAINHQYKGETEIFKSDGTLVDKSKILKKKFLDPIKINITHKVKKSRSNDYTDDLIAQRAKERDEVRDSISEGGKRLTELLQSLIHGKRSSKIMVKGSDCDELKLGYPSVNGNSHNTEIVGNADLNKISNLFKRNWKNEGRRL